MSDLLTLLADVIAAEQARPDLCDFPAGNVAVIPHGGIAATDERNVANPALLFVDAHQDGSLCAHFVGTSVLRLSPATIRRLGEALIEWGEQE